MNGGKLGSRSAYIYVLESPPPADVINKDHSIVDVAGLYIVDELLKSFSTLYSQSASPRINIGSNNSDLIL